MGGPDLATKKKRLNRQQNKSLGKVSSPLKGGWRGNASIRTNLNLVERKLWGDLGGGTKKKKPNGLSLGTGKWNVVKPGKRERRRDKRVGWGDEKKGKNG